MMYDFAIVGSGVSGGRVAYELTRAGAKCILLEAGRHFTHKTFPDNELDYSSQMFWGGGLELSQDANLGFLRAKCVGGTSIVNQALLDEFDNLVWDDWTSRSGIDFFNAREFSDQYNAILEEISHSEIPKEYWNPNSKIFIGALEKLGYQWKPLLRAQKNCALDKGSDCIVCLGGCPRDSKQSALVTTIQWAIEKGLEIKSEFEALDLDIGSDSVNIRGIHSRQKTEIKAAKVFLAAGALGNSAILLRSHLNTKLPVGTNFSCHPQFMTYAVFDQIIDAHKGAFQAVKSDDEKLRKMGLKLENVFAPPIGTAMLFPGIGRSHQRLMKKYRHMASMEVALRDEPSGKIQLSAKGKLIIQKSLTRSDQEKASQGLKLVRNFFEACGAKEIVTCHQGFGLHLMGGCPIGTNGRSSVVNPEFKLHDHPNVFLADSSIFPAAPGINPSFTVMAIARKAAMMAVSR